MTALMTDLWPDLDSRVYLLGREVITPLPPEYPAAGQQEASYSVLFPVRPRVLARFSREQVEMAARVAFWQHPPDECVIPEQALDLEWSEDMLGSGTKLIRVAGDVIPPAVEA